MLPCSQVFFFIAVFYRWWNYTWFGTHVLSLKSAHLTVAGVESSRSMSWDLDLYLEFIFFTKRIVMKELIWDLNQNTVLLYLFNTINICLNSKKCPVFLLMVPIGITIVKAW